VQLSIVVTSYDPQRRRDITDLLDSIHVQLCNDFELVYVTERSKLLHNFVKESIEKRGIRGKVIHNEGSWGLSECRNIGVEHSKGEVIAFVDDDVILDSNWSCAILNAFKSLDGIIGATGPAYPYWLDNRADWLPTELDWLIGCTRWFKSNVPVQVRNCWGMNMCFAREAFQKAGYFDVRSTERSRYLRSASGQRQHEETEQGKMAEDVEYSLRVKRMTGKKLYYLPDMRVLSKVYSYRLSSRFIVARSSWIGYSRRNIAKVAGNRQLTIENSLLVSLLRSLLLQNRNRPNLTGELKKTKVSILALFSIALGYFMGPLT
jgi:glycosyltransferase involved in cell wall biosynthesis